MLLVFCIGAALVVGSSLVGACERPKRFLVSAGATRTAYAWPSEHVELHCRPSTEGQCRWTDETGEEVDKTCTFTTSRTGIMTCKQMEENCGSINLSNPREQRLSRRNRDYRYRYYRHYNSADVRQNNYLCSDTGTIIQKTSLCDNIIDCDNGEDELHCKHPCGKPHLPEHAVLTQDAKLYPHGAVVTYTCSRGFTFTDTLGNVTRTCELGDWSGAAPVCRRNLALHSRVHVQGGPPCDSALVDGHVDTWCLLPPSRAPQWLAVTVADSGSPAAAYRVFVRALQTQLSVTLQSANDSEAATSCDCAVQQADVGRQRLVGLLVCDCLSSDQLSDHLSDHLTPLTVVVAKQETAELSQLSVAEVVVISVAPLGQPEPCGRLDGVAHGRYSPVSNSTHMRLLCQPGYEASCDSDYQATCADLLSGSSQPRCLSHTCLTPPIIPHTELMTLNNTNFGYLAKVQYTCSSRYELVPPDQTTAALCQVDGLWSLGHIVCLPDTDTRVVALRLARQHQKAMDQLSSQLRSGQLDLLHQLRDTQWLMRDTRQRLVRLEKAAGLETDVLWAESAYSDEDGSGNSQDTVGRQDAPWEEASGMVEPSAALVTNLSATTVIDNLEKKLNTKDMDIAAGDSNFGNDTNIDSL